MSRGRLFLLWWVIVMAVGAASIWPVIRSPGTAFAYGGDDALIAWQISKTIEKLENRTKDFFQGNIYYPYKDSSAYMVLLVPSAILTYLPAKVIGTHIAGYNLAMILAQFSCMTILYLWFAEMCKKPWAAAFGTIAFGLSGIRMFFDVHIHMFLSQWFLISVYMLWKYSRSGKAEWLYPAGIFWAIQFWESMYQAYWIWFFVAVFLGPKWRNLWRQRKHVFVILMITAMIAGPAAAAYLRVYKEFGIGGSIRESANFSASVNDLWGKFGSVGLEMAVILVMVLSKQRYVVSNRWLWGLLVFGIIMSLGPVLKWHDETWKPGGKWWVPMPYGLYYYLVPGASAMRSVHRYIWLAGLAMGGIVSMGLSGVKIDSQRKKLGAAGILLLIILGGGRMTPRRDFPTPSSYPEVYGWMQNTSGRVIFEYPFYTWTDKDFSREMFRMVYNLKSGKEMIGGAAGFIPPEREKLLGEVMRGFPDEKSISLLRGAGTHYVVVHKQEVLPEIVEKTDKSPELKKLWENAEDTVYEL